MNSTHYPNQDARKDERIRLQKALELNKPLSTAYYMKERLRFLFQWPNLHQARLELNSWLREAQNSDIKILKDAARKLTLWKPFILNWYKHNISSAKIEATNQKISLLQRNAYGYRDNQYFNLRIYHIHMSNYSLCCMILHKFARGTSIFRVSNCKMDLCSHLFWPEKQNSS
jgi:transposase